MQFKSQFVRYMAPAGGENEGGAGADDRGDAVKTPDQVTAAEEAAAAEKQAAEEAAKAEAEKKAAESGGEAETAEEKAAREAEEAAHEQKKRVRIPLARHEEILDRARRREEALVARIEQLEAKAPAEPKKDALVEMRKELDSLQDQYEKHVFDGKPEEARKIRAELELLRDRYVDAKVSRTSDAARTQTIDQLKYEASLAKYEAAFPAINPDTDSFDELKANEVAELMSTFVRAGHTRHSALDKAVRYVMGTPAEKKAPGDDVAAQLARKREQEARQKAAEAAAKQPQNLSSVGADNDKGGKPAGAPNWLTMTQAQFDKLDEAQKIQNRGDTV